VAQLIQILEWEGRIAPGQVKRSTLQEQLAQRGYSTRHLRLYASAGVAARRYQQRYRNQLWHSDIKYGPYLPIGPQGSKKQVYLVTFVDDATRFVLHGEFYPSLDQLIVEEAFRRAIQQHGLPEAVYFDNGKQYRNQWMTRTCSQLGIRLLFARPYSPESTGQRNSRSHSYAVLAVPRPLLVAAQAKSARPTLGADPAAICLMAGSPGVAVAGS
jgi:transposase InsO family protein